MIDKSSTSPATNPQTSSAKQVTNPLVVEFSNQVSSDADLIEEEVDFDKALNRRQREQQITQEQFRFDAEMEEKKIDRNMKKNVATIIFTFLAVETVAVFAVLALQGFKPLAFNVQDTTLNIFLGATILQISAMAIMVIRHLFPTK